MAFLTAELPSWTDGLAAIVDAATRRLEDDHPEVAAVRLGPSLDGGTLVAHVGQVRTGGRLAAAYTVACDLADLWPDWLADEDVALRVIVPGLVVDTGPDDMAEVAAGLTRTAWVAASALQLG